jgi:hypothetical protein
VSTEGDTLTTVWTTPTDAAPWPANEDEVTAESLARALAVRAYARAAWAKGNVDDPFMHSIAVESIQADYATVSLLRTLAGGDEVTAAAAARHLWRTWRDGDATVEYLWRGLTDYGIDPERVAEFAREGR